MHNDIMAAGSKDHPPMLAMGRYAQDICNDKSPCSNKTTTETDPSVLEHTVQETHENILPENCAYIDAEAESIHMILSRIRDEIYSMVNAYKTAQEIIKGKEVTKLRTPPSLSASEEDSDPQQAQRDKDIQKSITLIEKYFTKIYKPTNNNLRTSSNSRNKNVEPTLRTRNDRQSGKPQGKDDVDTDEESNEQELEAHYMYMEKIYEVLHVNDDNSRPTYDIEPLEQNADDNDEDERVELANLIANLKLDIDKNKKIQKQLRKANAQLTNEFNESKSALTELNDIRDRCKSALHQKEVELEKYITYKNCQLEKEEIERKYKETLDLLAQQKHKSHEALKTQAYETFEFKEKNDPLIHQGSLEKIRYDLLRKEKEQFQKDFKISQDKDIDKINALENQVKFLNDVVYKTNQYVQTIHMLAPNSSSYYNDRASFVNHMYLKKAQSKKPCLYKVSYDKDDLANIFAPNYDETLILEEESRSKLDKDLQSRMEHRMDKPITHEITVLVKDLLMPLAERTRANASEFEIFLKEEMFDDL
ncbi:hypothetical protein Tco_0375220 [Tanacetum coccineum]